MARQRRSMMGGMLSVLGSVLGNNPNPSPNINGLDPLGISKHRLPFEERMRLKGLKWFSFGKNGEGVWAINYKNAWRKWKAMAIFLLFLALSSCTTHKYYITINQAKPCPEWNTWSVTPSPYYGKPFIVPFEDGSIIEIDTTYTFEWFDGGDTLDMGNLIWDIDPDTVK